MKWIDLSHRLKPKKQRFKLELDLVPVGKWIPEYKTGNGDWYVMGDLRMCTHVGTHIEAPLHAVAGGTAANELPPQTLIGMAAILDFSDKGYGDCMTRAEMEARGTHVKKGDIVLLKTGLGKYYGTERYRRPYMEKEAVQWLVDREIKCLGLDCSGIENRRAENHNENHLLLFENGIPLIEDMNHLDQITAKRVFFFALPLNIDGLDASMLRPVALEPEGEAVDLYEQYFENIDWTI